MNLLMSIKRLLTDNSVSKIEVSWPYGKLTFDRDELVSLLQSQALVADAVSRHFVRRRVFWEDFAAEGEEYSMRSLSEAENGLDMLATDLGRSKEPTAIALSKFARSWATACALTRKRLKEELDDIDEEKAHVPGYDFSWEDRQTALREALVSLRRTVYPLVIALIAFIPDDDPTKGEAQSKIDDGLNLLPDARLQREVIPDVDAAT